MTLVFLGISHIHEIANCNIKSYSKGNTDAYFGAIEAENCKSNLNFDKWS